MGQKTKKEFKRAKGYKASPEGLKEFKREKGYKAPPSWWGAEPQDPTESYW